LPYIHGFCDNITRMNKYKKTRSSFFVLTLLLGVLSCEKSSSDVELLTPSEGYLSLDVMVNPMIHSYAESYFLSVNETRIEGVDSDSLFSAFEFNVDAGRAPSQQHVYSTATLSPGGYVGMELDFNTKAGVGCSVTNLEGQNDPLGKGVDEVHTLQIDGNFLIEGGVTSKQVLLLDLNELISPVTDGEIDFSFRQNPINRARFRLYDPAKIGRLKGDIVRTLEAPRQTYRLVAYAYRIGSFEPVIEIQNGFSTAFISANVGRNDQFIFPVLPEGLFEIVIAHYTDNDGDGLLEFKELLQADADINSDTRMARVSAKTETSIHVSLGGVVGN